MFVNICLFSLLFTAILANPVITLASGQYFAALGSLFFFAAIFVTLVILPCCVSVIGAATFAVVLGP